jgi:hypothetical protein
MKHPLNKVELFYSFKDIFKHLGYSRLVKKIHNIYYQTFFCVKLKL